MRKKIIKDGDEARMEEGLVRLLQGVRHVPFPSHPPAPPPPRVTHAHLAQWREREGDSA